MENKHNGKSSAGPAFLWGFILGAIFATLLTTKKGRAILRELVNAGTEMVEDFIAQRKDKAYEKTVAQRETVLAEVEQENVVEAMEDIEAETTASETPPTFEAKPEVVEEIVIDEVSDEAITLAKKLAEKEKLAAASQTPAKLGSKRRLFKGIRKSKAN